jgi:hypothetical protein
VVLTPSRRQLRRCEAGWEGSPRRNPAPRNTNRVEGGAIWVSLLKKAGPSPSTGSLRKRGGRRGSGRSYPGRSAGVPVCGDGRCAGGLRREVRADRAERAGIDLTTEPLVGLGSVCRHRATAEVARLVHTLHAHGLTRLHGLASNHRTAALRAPADLRRLHSLVIRRPPSAQPARLRNPPQELRQLSPVTPTAGTPASAPL